LCVSFDKAEGLVSLPDKVEGLVSLTDRVGELVPVPDSAQGLVPLPDRAEGLVSLGLEFPVHEWRVWTAVGDRRTLRYSQPSVQSPRSQIHV
jgi:hypothetical protein